MGVASTLRMGSGGVFERPTEEDFKEAAEEAAEGAPDHEGFRGGRRQEAQDSPDAPRRVQP